MPSLYYALDRDPNIGPHFGVKPYNRDWTAFHSLSKRVNLKADLGWKEVTDLQKIICAADMWADFPAKGFTLVAAEFRPGDENQRVDLLYLRNDGALLPAELKIGGDAKDSHGQLIRYIADLHFQPIDISWVRNHRNAFESKMKTDIRRTITNAKFEKFIDSNSLGDRFIRLLPKHGMLIDENFPPQMLKAVRYLNDCCGFSFQLLLIEAFVDDGWNPTQVDYIMRIDLTLLS